MTVLRQLNRQQKLTIVMVTHDSWIAEQADRVVCLAEGRIESAVGAAVNRSLRERFVKRSFGLRSRPRDGESACPGCQ